MSDPNTRKEKRTPVTLKIKFKSATLDQFIERYSVDVSHGGIFIRTKDPLAVGTQLRFEFQLQDASPLISGEGTVVWTREHDPARVGVAPGMGVRFDKLASESQAVLDKILAMKSKEGTAEPKFDTVSSLNDPKTKVAPAPLVSGLAAQSAEKTRVAPPPTGPPPIGPRSTVMGLGPSIAVPPSGGAVASGKGGLVTGKPNTVPAKAVGNLAPSRGGFPEEPSRDATPLPKPMPFSSVDDDFSEEAFNQPTRVAGSFEDLLRKAEQEAAANEGKGPLAAKEPAPAIDTKVTVLPAPQSASTGNGTNGAGASRTSGEQAAAAEALAAAERRAAEVKAAEDNEIKAAADKRALSDRRVAEERAANEKQAAAAKAAERRLSEERAAEAARPAVAARRSGTQPTLPSVDYTERKKRSPAVLVVGVLLIGGGAFAAYSFMNRGGETTAQTTPGAGGETPAATAPTPPPVDPNAKPAAAVTADAAAAPAPTPPPAAPKGIEVQVVSTPPGAAVMADGKQVGVTPFSLAGLEDGKAYDISLELPCYQPSKLTIDASKEKASDAKVEATLKPLPRVVRVATDPKGGAIWIDGVNTGKQSPADLPLAGKLDPTKAHKVMVKKSGYQPGETEIAPDATCTAENGKAVLIASLTLAEVEKKAPPLVDKRDPVVKKPKPPKDVPPPDDGTTPTGLLPKDSGTTATPPPDTTPPAKEPPAKEPPAKTPPKEPAKEPPKDNPDEHAPDWMKEG